MMRIFASIFILISLLFHTVSYAEITADSTYSDLAPTAAADKGRADAIGSYVASTVGVINTVVEDVMNMSCETQTFLNLFKGQLTNSCTPIPLLNFALKSLMVPGSLAAFMRVSMNNPALLGLDNCSYFNRADYYSPTVSFGVCLDYIMFPNVLKNIFYDSIVSVVKGMAAGHKDLEILKDFQRGLALRPQEIYSTWGSIAHNVSFDFDSINMPNFNSYYEKNKFYYSVNIPEGKQKSDHILILDVPIASYLSLREGNTPGSVTFGSAFQALTLAPLMNLALKKYDDKVCVIVDNYYMQNQIGCKYMKDPYMYSKYAPFQGETTNLIATARATSDNNSTPYSALQAGAQQDLGCNNLNTCYYSAVNASKALLPISSPIINCVQSMLMNVVGASSVCTNTPLLNDPTTSIGSSTSAFYSLQLVLRKSVIALLTLYIMFGGIKIVLGHMTGSSEIIMFFLKAMLVSYFSIGLVYNGQTFSGMIDWVFPTFFGALNDMAGWVAGASTSGLCSYTSADYTGTSYALWDALDCRVATYIGINGAADLFTSLRDNGVVDSGSLTTNLGAVNYSIPPYMLLLLPALYTGNMYLFNLAIAWPIMVLAIGAYIVQSTIVCMIFIAIMGILAPLFVPMALFDYTKEYFEKWRNTFFSFVLQPTISITFMVILFSVYDYGFYGDCQYKPFYIKSPTGATLKSFYIDINGGNVGNCNRTLGWWLSEKYDFSSAPTTNGIPTVTLLQLNDIGYAAMIDNTIQGAKSIVLNTGKVISGVAESLTYDSSGSFMNVATASMKEFFGLCMSLMTACFTLYIGYQLTEELTKFASELTGGMSVGGMVSSVTQNFNKMSQTASGAYQRHLDNKKKNQPERLGAGSGEPGKVKEDGAKDSVKAGGRDGAKDMSQAGGGGAKDKVQAEGKSEGSAADSGSKSQSSGGGGPGV